MTKRYERELNQLSDVYCAALKLDNAEIVQLVERMSQSPLVTVGSGGSYSTASFAAGLHEYCTGQPARAATPLEIISSRPRRAATLCFSASGRNRDIGVAFQIAAQAEAGPVGALVLSKDTPLHGLQSRYSYSDVVGEGGSLFKDGFLAVSSMIMSAILLKRAYDDVFGSNSPLPATLEKFARRTIDRKSFAFVEHDVRDVIANPYLSMLFSPSMVSTAVDLESRFVEASLGAIHTADFRNFGHGRHHWIAKRGEDTGLVALVGEQDNVLATRTLDLIPHATKTWRIDVSGAPDEQAIAGLLIGLYLSSAAGRAAGIDPGKPGVPEFGRKLYGLGPSALRRKPSDVNKAIAIQRKAPEANKDSKSFGLWGAAYERVQKRWAQATIGAIVFDYDGTLCDPRNRFGSLSHDVSSALVKLLDGGLKIGVATGRGPSAGVALRDCIPANYWPDVVMGYYNGAVLTGLDNDQDPIIDPCESDSLLAALTAHPVLQDCEFRSNAAQIALRLPAYLDVSEVISAVNAVLSDTGFAAPVTASSHSVDIQFGLSSKADVVNELQSRIREDQVVMRLGDKGVWPGNDAEFLDSAFGMSVDEASRHSDHCWALAPAGVRGVQATLYFLGSLQLEGSVARLRMRPGDRGNVYAS